MYGLRIAIFLAASGYAGWLFWQAFYAKLRFLRAAQPEDRTGQRKRRLGIFFKYVLGQAKVLAEPAGIGHFLIFWGFIVLSVGTLDFIGFHIFGRHLLWIGDSGWFRYLHELFSLLVLLAVAIAWARRYFFRPMRLDQSSDAYVILALLAGLILTDTAAQSLDIALGDAAAGLSAPMASGIASLLSVDWRIAAALRELFIWLHLAILLGFLVFIPRSKHLHMLAAPFNTYYRSLRPYGQLRSLDLEDESIEEFGVGRMDQFTWKQLLDGYACTECGRCHVSCPATLTGKPLSPKHLILKMRDHLTDVAGPIMIGSAGAQVEGKRQELPALIGDVYSEEEIWACTTCRACEEACPVFNEHVDKIVDLRRYLVMTDGKSSSEMKRAFNNLERHSNEWGQSRSERADWAKELPVRTMEQADGDVEYLYYVGSAVSFDPRNQKIAQAFVKLLNEAGISFAILGTLEESDGDAARRLGNELLFQELAKSNIEQFHRYGIKKIVTTDPHAYNTIKNEYSQFGFEAEVYHATELLAQLVETGQLKPTRKVDITMTYHDSCYLGRYNGIFSAPRYILSQIPGLRVVEMERNRERGMCCGAGGGSMWKEETGDKRINVFRVEQAMDTGCQAIGTACPFCMTMMIDGTKQKGVEDTMPTFDVVELLAQSVS
ncbi:MAG: hypothetical protein JWN30_163 [Bacilli bacterium]|nr:hypothetical protein [Bacilli bacterium]